MPIHDAMRYRLALLLLCCGCTGTARLYEGAPRTAGEVAVVNVGSTIVRAIDGQPRRGGAFDAIAFELPPGPHELTLVFELPARTVGIRSLPAQQGSGTCVLAFEAAAGKQYFLGARASSDVSLHWNGSWSAWVRDPSTATEDDVVAHCDGGVAVPPAVAAVSPTAPASAPPAAAPPSVSAGGTTSPVPVSPLPVASAVAAVAPPVEIRLGTWNLRGFGTVPGKDLQRIAAAIDGHFDILTLTEISGDGGPAAYQRLMIQLGATWAGLLSPAPHPPASASGSEYYAIVYRRDRLRPCAAWEPLRELPVDAEFVHAPGVGCFEAGDGASLAFLLAAYHATAADGDAALVAAEASHLDALFAAMQAARPGDAALLIAGDFNLEPAELATVNHLAVRGDDGGATLDLLGNRTARRTDHILLDSPHPGVDVVGVATAIDLRSASPSAAEFYRTISDHLPVVMTLRSAQRTDDGSGTKD
ncbi:MAG: endonuclease/exonuclease/phosphatase family protein [bacterium]